MLTENRGVEAVIDEYTSTRPIWVVKPKHEGIGADYKPDQVLIIKGFCIGVECKRNMRLGNKSSLPTAGQTHELRKLILAGGAGCAIDINSVQQFLTMLSALNDPRKLLSYEIYQRVFCIENWATEPKEVVI